MYILMDFVTRGIEEDLQASYLLKTPLLSPSSAYIDVQKGELTLFVGKGKAKFNIYP